MDIFNKYFNNTNLDDANDEEDDSDTSVLIAVLAWHIKF